MAIPSSRTQQQAGARVGTNSQPPSENRWLGPFLGFCTWLALWALLSQGQGWAFGVPLALIGAFVGYRLRLHTGKLRLQVLPAFIGFFLLELFAGGWDVARRALHPKLPIAPAWQTFELTATDPRAKLLLSALVGLLPGTLASHHEEQTLHIHALDQQQDWQSTVTRLEALLAQLLGDTPS